MSTIISIYEVLMIIFALIKYVNHHARLVVVSARFKTEQYVIVYRVGHAWEG